MEECAFAVASAIEEASSFIMQLPLSQLRLMDDSRFPWVLLVPSREELAEWSDLHPAELQQLAREIRWATRLVEQWAHPHKVNVASLGNVVRQMHVHVVGRETTDIAWPGAVWGCGKAIPYSAEEKSALQHQLSSAMLSIWQEETAIEGD